MKAQLWRIVLEIAATGVILLTAIRTVDLLKWTTTNELVAYLGVLVLDGGMYLWARIYMHAAHGATQRAVALLVTAIDLVGVGVTFTADMVINTAQRGLIGQLSPQDTQTIIAAIAVVTIVNVAAFIVYAMASPDLQMLMAEEYARGKIDAAKLKRIRERADTLAAEVAPELEEAWVDEMRAQYKAQRRPQPSANSHDGAKPAAPMHAEADGAELPKGGRRRAEP